MLWLHVLCLISDTMLWLHVLFVMNQIVETDQLQILKNDIVMSRRLTNKIVFARQGISLVDCVRECMSVSRCKSVNYIRRLLLCELNKEPGTSDDADFIKEATSIHVNLQYWLTVGIYTNVNITLNTFSNSKLRSTIPVHWNLCYNSLSVISICNNLQR